MKIAIFTNNHFSNRGIIYIYNKEELNEKEQQTTLSFTINYTITNQSVKDIAKSLEKEQVKQIIFTNNYTKFFKEVENYINNNNKEIEILWQLN